MASEPLSAVSAAAGAEDYWPDVLEGSWRPVGQPCLWLRRVRHHHIKHIKHIASINQCPRSVKSPPAPTATSVCICVWRLAAWTTARGCVGACQQRLPANGFCPVVLILSERGEWTGR